MSHGWINGNTVESQKLDECTQCPRTALLDGGSRDRCPVVSLGIFSLATDVTMCPGVDSASKNEYQDTPGGKDGRCVKMTTLPPS
jgi:hypothetical protein